MADKFYESDVQQLRIISQKLKSLITELDGESRKLRSEIDVLSLSWKGEAGKKLVSGFETDADQLDEAIRDVNELYEIMNKVCVIEEENDETIGNLVRSINV